MDTTEKTLSLLARQDWNGLWQLCAEPRQCLVWSVEASFHHVRQNGWPGRTR